MTRAIASTFVIFGIAGALALGAAGLAGCGASKPKPAELSGIEALRREAKAHPNDPDVQRRLAIAELLAVDGDPARAKPQIARALELSPEDERLLLLAGTERQVHGAPEAAFDRFVEALEAAAGSSRSEAPAVAEVAAASVEELVDLVPGFAEAFDERLAPLVDRPGDIGVAASATLADVATELAYRDGDVDEVERVASGAGCVTEWRVAGPFGPRALLGFDREHADAADTGPLADEYDLGPRRGARPTRELRARGCTVHVGGGPVAGAGTTYAEGSFETQRRGEHVIRLETPNAAELFVDGESVARLDMRREPTPRVSFHPVELEAGEHEVTVKIASRHPNPVLQLAVARGPVSGGGDGGAGDGGDGDLLAVYLHAATAGARGDWITTREALRGTDESGQGSTAMLQLRAAAALNDSLRPSDMRRDEARRLMRGVAERDPQAWQPALRLAQLASADGRLTAAIERLRKAQDRWPEMLPIPLTLVDLLLRRGWDAEARKVIAEAREVVPGGCPAIRAQLELARQRDRTGEIRELTEQIVACDARSEAHLSELVRQRRWDAALEEVDRLAALEPPQNQAQVVSGKLEIARARGDDERVRKLLERLGELEPRSSQVPLQQADMQLASGDRKAATRTLEQALETDPSAMASLRWPRRLLADDTAIDELRADGAEALREFEESGRSYDAPQVLVFDYMAVRVFEDGSKLEIVHQIHKVQSEEAVDDLGEYAAPNGARVLTLHTVKADGERLEPDRIGGKESISLPSLEVGDYVESEYVQMTGPPKAFPTGVIGARFYFQSFEIPFDVSVYRVAVPESMELMTSPRGPAPKPKVTEAGGLRVHTWEVSEQEALEQEPSSVPPREWVPSIDWGVDAGWEPLIDGLRDLLADKDVRDPAAARLARRIAGEGSDRDRARRLYHWVLENVENNDEVFGLAPAMLAGRTGDRTRILRYLLDLVGIDSQLLFARDVGSDQTRAELADQDTYDHPILKLGGDDPLYVATSQRGAPFGYMPPALRGQDAIVLAKGAPRVELPPLEPGQDAHRYVIDVQLRRDGSAHLRVVETLRGSGAVMWRNNLEGVPKAVLEERFGTQYVARLVPGAELTSLEIGGREAPEKPFVMRYEFDVGSLGRRRGERWMVSPLFTNDLAPVYARTAKRTTAQLVVPPVDTRVTLRLHAPEGASPPPAPEDVELEGPGGARFTLSAERKGDTLVLERHMWMPIMRVSAKAYPRFAEYCRAVDQAEGRELPIRL